MVEKRLAAKEVPAAEKFVSPEEFVTRWPLYSIARVQGFSMPQRISFVCDGTCDKETTWALLHEPERVNPDERLRTAAYMCILCSANRLHIIYREHEHEHVHGTNPNLPSTHSVLTHVIKIGQYPALSIAVPKDLAKALSADGVELYKKALVCRNNGYGLGAVVYIRRIVEDKTNELIEVAARLAETYEEIDPSVVAQMRAVVKGRAPYDEKLKLAATVLPSVVKVKGVNPLSQLYGLVSRGIHTMSEEQCVEIANETSDVFNYIFANLRMVAEERKSFIEKVSKWAGGKSGG